MSRSSKGKCSKDSNTAQGVVAEFTVSGTTLQEGGQTVRASTTTTTTSSRSNNNNANTTNNNNNNTPCLHCHSRKSILSSGIQVSCDECHAHICNDCHWCHEFQANHEIRVCDRCESFYCRQCDEMDQCDDCGEVVCGACSSLLSCKFCGGGLCPDCATACGKCGIVLCSRDSKFAVECDICKLSYCLVCLASSNKDPCVRCGHRPSKRMEQLVHLRLKSIYKAFQQSNPKKSGSGSNRGGGGGGGADSASTRAVAAAAAAACGASSSSSSSGVHGGGGSSRGDSLSGSSAAGMGGAFGSGTASRDKRDKVEAAAKSAEEAAKLSFSARQAEADLAAAALLAELEEEEQLERKKSVKKKKKRASQKKKQRSSGEEPTGEGGAALEDGAEDHGEEEQSPPAGVTGVSSSSLPVKEKGKLATNKKGWNESFANDDDDEEEDGLPTSPPPEQEEKMDPDEVRLYEMVADSDGNGIEALLAELKGVPGKAALRKNAKKALKRLREQEEKVKLEREAEFKLAVTSTSASSSGNKNNEAAPASSFSTAANATGATSAGTTANKDTTTTTLSSGYKPPEPLLTLISRNVHSNSKSECVLHMSPQVVGWVIGKGGQRIRDLMEDSGSKVWIDQDSMGPNDARIVYVSGQGKAVDDAVRRIKDLVAKAPVGASTGMNTAASAAASQTLSGSHKKTPPSPDIKPMDGSGAGAGSLPSKPSPGRARSSSATSKDKDWAVHEITCEARFVPLLIGRRGWTIKHIQDSSGARVDIDQSVTPRRIKISGKKDCVAIAIRMVKDVLSYPHAQLDKSNSGGPPAAAKAPPPTAPAVAPTPSATTSGPSTIDAPSNTAVGPPLPLPPLPVSSAAVGGTGIDELASLEAVRNLSNHSPPPSSLIMTGDIKGTISASSSLSSTPEPSMASTSKSSSYKHPGQLSSGDVIPPNFAAPTPPYLQASLQADVAQQSRGEPPLAMPSPTGSSGRLRQPTPHDLRFVNNPQQGGLTYIQQQPLSPFDQQPRAGMPFVHPPQQQQGQQQALHHSNSAPIGSLGAPGFGQSQHLGNARSPYGQQQVIGGSSLLRDALGAHSQQQQPPQQHQGAIRQDPIGQSGMPQQQQQQQGRPMSSYPSDPYQSAQLLFQKQETVHGGNVNDTEAFTSDLFGRSRNLQVARSASEHGTMDHSSSQYLFQGQRLPHRQNSDSQIPPHMYAEQQSPSHVTARRNTMPMHSSGMADSDIVDSLFGPSGSGGEQSLLSGIQGLNLNSNNNNNNTASGPGWSSSIAGWGGENNSNAGGAVPLPDQSIGELNGGMLHGSQRQRQNPAQPAQQSRFDWG